METKKCPKCGEIKFIDLFYKSKATKDGIKYECKKCTSKTSLIWRRKNVEQYSKYSKKSVEELSNSYIADTLKLPTAILTPELILLKREQLINKRALRLLNKTLKELNEK